MKSTLFAIGFFYSVNIFSQKEMEPKIGYTPAIDGLALQRLEIKKAQMAKLEVRIKNGLKRDQMTLKEKELYDEFNTPDNSADPWSLGTDGCSWYCGAVVKEIKSSSTLKSQGSNHYEAKNAHDFTLNNAWVEGVSGYGIGEYIEYTFPKNNPTVTTVIIFNGYVKSDKAWIENSRIKKLKMYVNGKPYAILNLQDTKAQQTFDIGTLKNKTSDLILRFEILDVYKGTKWDDTVLSELYFDGTDVHCFVGESLVSMADGSQKEIKEITKGDRVVSYNFSIGQIEEAEVIEIASQKHHNLVKYNFSETTLIGTNDHPFYVLNIGWASLMPSSSLQYIDEVVLMEKSNLMLGLNSKRELDSQILKDFERVNSCEWTYTITKLSRNNSFFVNGLLVSTEDQRKSNHIQIE